MLFAHFSSRKRLDKIIQSFVSYWRIEPFDKFEIYFELTHNTNNGIFLEVVSLLNFEDMMNLNRLYIDLQCLELI